MTGDWRKLRHEELCDLYCSTNISATKPGMMTRARRVACMEEGRDVYSILLGNPEGKIPFVRTRRGWTDSIYI